MTPAQIIARAERARELLAHPAFAETLGALQERVTEAWTATAQDDWRRREQLYGQLQSLLDFKAQLDLFVSEGSLVKR